MKILKRKEFLKMPYGTIYQSYEPCNFGHLQIKYENSGDNDFSLQDLTTRAIKCDGYQDLWEKLDDAENLGARLEMDFDCCQREGMFLMDSALYAVWEKPDIEALIKKLTECL